MLKDEELEALKEYFKQHKDVAFAFLFGSQAEGRATKLSDVDIAVYFHPKEQGILEFQKEVFYEGETKIWSDLENILRKEVELVILNRAPATIAASAIGGIPLAINDWKLYLRFMEMATSEAIEFREMLIENFKNKEK